MANIFQKLAFATASVALSIAALDINPAQAAIMKYDFKVVPDSGPLLGNEYTGSFSYDDLTIGGPGTGEQFLEVTDFYFFDFEGVDYNKAFVSPEVVEALFYDGEFLGLNFGADDFSFIPGFFALDEAYVGYDIDAGAGAADIIYKKVPPKTVPEPSALLGLGLLGGGLLLKKTMGKSKSR